MNDSYPRLPHSLRQRGKMYECVSQKGYFPYVFAFEDNLFDVGPRPSLDYYNHITDTEYNSLYYDNWSFKHVTLEYLTNDLNTHYEVMSKLNEALFLKDSLDLTKSLTVSGIALRLFMRNYYKNNIANISKHSMYTELKQGYYGGRTEIYRPHGYNLYYYDINSLYPHASLDDMAGLVCTKVFIIDSNEKEIPFGFFYCIVDATSVDVKYLGLLPLRGKNLSFPLGKWKGWYFSAELEFAVSNRYRITLLHGYTFSKSKNVFNKYVTHVHSNKVSAKNSVEKSLPKSMLNNLLGRFGIKLDKFKTKLVE